MSSSSKTIYKKNGRGVSPELFKNFVDFVIMSYASSSSSSSNRKNHGISTVEESDNEGRGPINYESIPDNNTSGIQRCFFSYFFITIYYVAIEGYVIFVGNLDENIQTDYVKDIFSNYGVVKDIQMNLNRRNGYMKVQFKLLVFSNYVS
jgi:hypothetical protein